jgi:phosphate uptake regulator
VKKTEGFIQKNESLLEQVKEKERVIDEMYQEDCKKLANTDCITTFTSSIHTHFQIQKHFFFQLFLCFRKLVF